MSFPKATLSTALVLSALIFLLAACAGSVQPERGIVDAETLDEDIGIVFGTIEPNYYDAKGAEVAGKRLPEMKYELFFGDAENLGVKRTFSGFNQSISIATKDPETFFVLQLPQGEYSMFKLEKYLAPDKPVREGAGDAFPSDVRFTVAPKQATYIGSLQVNFRATRSALGQQRLGDKVAFSVADKSDAATKTFQERNPDLKIALTKNLMQVKRAR